MPELPEVETTRLGLVGPITQKSIIKVVVRQPKLRLPVNADLKARCEKQTITKITRRAKYLRLHLNQGYIIIHLGMSGHLRLVDSTTPLKKHDHVDIIFSDDTILRFNDPRRFGLLQWSNLSESEHPLLNHLGPEPFSKNFSSTDFYQKLSSTKRAIKKVIMDNRIVVGVGNIYAQECLFMVGISPLKPANELSKTQCQTIRRAIKTVLKEAIQLGGTTLKDFQTTEGKPGYFAQELKVYGRQGEPCLQCNTILQQVVLGGRNTVYCLDCQT